MVNFVLLSLAFLSFSLPAGIGIAQPNRPERQPWRPERTKQIETGFLFINGRYISPPYELEFKESEVLVNGEAYGKDDFDLSRNQRQNPRMRTPEGGGRWGAFMRDVPEPSPLLPLWRDLRLLEAGSVIVLASQRQPLVLWPEGEAHELLKTLVLKTSGSSETVAIPKNVSSEADRETWQQLAAEFTASGDFMERAAERVEAKEAVIMAVEKQLAATRLSEKLSYPLTIFAIVVMVFASGHLMSNAQHLTSISDDPHAKSKIHQMTVRSLAIVGLLSVVDLVWTLMAHQAGSMRELNPLGSRMIDDPVQLILFKLTVTSISIGLLYWLRDLPFARQATWWSCLVLTLLTARWLVFHSMFI